MFKNIICTGAVLAMILSFSADQAAAKSLILFNQISCDKSDDIIDILRLYYVKKYPVSITDVIVSKKIENGKCVALDRSKKLSKIHVQYKFHPVENGEKKHVDSKSFTIYEAGGGYVLNIFDLNRIFKKVGGVNI